MVAYLSESASANSVGFSVPREREGSFESVIAKKRQCRLDSFDQIVFAHSKGFDDP